MNFPAVRLPKTEGETRIALLTKGVENPVDAAINGLGVAVSGAAGGVRGDYGYALISTRDDIAEIPAITGVVRSRILK